MFASCQGSASLEGLSKLPYRPALRPWISLLRGSNGEPTMLHNIGVMFLCICTAK